MDKVDKPKDFIDGLLSFLIGLFIYLAIGAALKLYWEWAVTLSFTGYANLNGVITTLVISILVYLTGWMIGSNGLFDTRIVTGIAVWMFLPIGIFLGWGLPKLFVALSEWIVR